MANSAILDDKQLFTSNQVFSLSSETSKSVILDVKQLFYKIRCLEGSETAKSVILEDKQLFRRFRDLKFGYFRR